MTCRLVLKYYHIIFHMNVNKGRIKSLMILFPLQVRRGWYILCMFDGNFVSATMHVSIPRQEKQDFLSIFYVLLRRETLWVVNPYPYNL